MENQHSNNGNQKRDLLLRLYVSVELENRERWYPVLGAVGQAGLRPRDVLFMKVFSFSPVGEKVAGRPDEGEASLWEVVF